MMCLSAKKQVLSFEPGEERGLTTRSGVIWQMRSFGIFGYRLNMDKTKRDMGFGAMSPGLPQNHKANYSGDSLHKIDLFRVIVV